MEKYIIVFDGCVTLGIRRRICPKDFMKDMSIEIIRIML